MENNKLAVDIRLSSVLKFAVPSMCMMAVMSLYVMVDAIFVANFVGDLALSAVNIVYPMISIIVAIAIMLATGSAAIVARKMGEKRYVEARENFSFIVASAFSFALGVTLLLTIFLEPILWKIGGTDLLMPYCLDYAHYLLPFLPLSMLQMLFQYYFTTAGKPHIGLALTILAGCANVFLDWLFIVHLDFGIIGASLGTGAAYFIPAVVGVSYFSLNRKGTLYFVKPKKSLKLLKDSCINGSSEMVVHSSIAIMTIIFNLQMLRLLGEDGVAAITIVQYSEFLLSAVFMGYASGVSPLIAYNFGTGNKVHLQKLLRISVKVLAVLAFTIFVCANIFADNIVMVFTENGSSVYEIATPGLRLFALSFVFSGVTIFTSAFFTALSNGKVSGGISFVRTFCILLPTLIWLPYVIDVSGVWLAVPIADFISMFVSLACLRKFRKRYGYY